MLCKLTQRSSRLGVKRSEGVKKSERMKEWTTERVKEWKGVKE